MSNNTPEIRFKGFTHAWEQRTLGEVADIFDGTHQTPNYVSEGIMFLSVENINTLTSKKFISEADYVENFKTAPKYGDILMTRIGDIGTANVIRTNEKLAYYVSLALLKPNKSDADFLTTSIHSPYVQKKLWERTLHVAFPKKINLGEIENIFIQAPSKSEQTRIGTFFRILDDTITLHKRKRDGLKELKRGYLQQMFPQAGESVPRVRFAGFTEPWVERKLGEVVESEIKGNAKAEMLGLESIYLDASYLNGGDQFYVDSPTNVQTEDVLILWDGSQAGTVYHGFTGALGSTLKAYKPKYSGSFLYQQLMKNQQKIYDSYRTPNIPHVIKTFTDEFAINIPTLSEQIAIGNFFRALDEQIATQQQKLSQLKHLKSACLQKMFI